MDVTEPSAGTPPGAYLGGEEAELALDVLVDVVLLAGEPPTPPAVLGLYRLVHSHHLSPLQETGAERETGYIDIYI